MGAHAITLHLPDPLYDHLKHQAKRARRSLEAELLRIVAAAAPARDAHHQDAREHGVTAAPSSRELSIEEAAAVLNVPETGVIQLFDGGELPHSGAGSERRVDLGDLIAYKQRDLTRRRRILAELSAEAQEMGLDY